MMEIVHDLAPGAQLFFATAVNGVASFANNIRTLRFVYGCDIIVDDFTYFNEGVFQDGPIAKAVNDVVANGALYFSSAANSGNLTSGTSGTWEGDFNAGPASGAPLPAGYSLHIFSGGQAFDVLTASTTFISTKWSDPLGGSTNDYDMFILNSAGTAVTCAATSVQSGTQDPYEFCSKRRICGQQSDCDRAEGGGGATRVASGYRAWPLCRSAPAAPRSDTTPESTPSPRPPRTGTARRQARGRS